MSAATALDRRVFVRALAASALVLPGCTTAPDPDVRPLKVLCVGFDYFDQSQLDLNRLGDASQLDPNVLVDLSRFGLAPLGSGQVARAMADRFALMPGSTVVKAVDDPPLDGGPCTRERLNGIVDTWAATIGPDDLAVIYYAGHGEVQDGGLHIITPDPYRIPIQDVISRVTRKNPYALVAFIDACRVPPMEEQIQRRRLDGALLSEEVLLSGGAPSSADNGEISVSGANIALIYATELYSTATMGAVTSWKSLFTLALENNLGARVDVMTLFARIIEDVDANAADLDRQLQLVPNVTAEDRARYKQQPWFTSSLHHPVYFAGKPARFGRAQDAWVSIPH